MPLDDGYVLLGFIARWVVATETSSSSLDSLCSFSRQEVPVLRSLKAALITPPTPPLYFHPFHA